jgi:hypothetical protein
MLSPKDRRSAVVNWALDMKCPGSTRKNLSMNWNDDYDCGDHDDDDDDDDNDDNDDD